MHEMSIALEIVNHVVKIARRHHAARIEEVQVEVGVMRQVVPEALELAFAAAAEGTPAEGARLRVTEQQLQAVCRQCECPFEPEIDRYLCPRCGQADARITAGNDLILRSVVCQVPDGDVPVPGEVPVS